VTAGEGSATQGGAGIEVQARVQRVLDRFNTILAPDEGGLSIKAIAGETVELDYVKGSNPRCDTCVLSAEDLAAMLDEALASAASGAARLRLVIHEA